MPAGGIPPPPDCGLEMGDEVAEGPPMARLTGCSAAYLNCLEFELVTGLGGRIPPFEELMLREDGPEL